METISLDRLKERIRIYGRKSVATKMSISYQVLTHKLNGFSEFYDEELDEILKILEEVK